MKNKSDIIMFIKILYLKGNIRYIKYNRVLSLIG